MFGFHYEYFNFFLQNKRKRIFRQLQNSMSIVNACKSFNLYNKNSYIYFSYFGTRYRFLKCHVSAIQDDITVKPRDCSMKHGVSLACY